MLANAASAGSGPVRCARSHDLQGRAALHFETAKWLLGAETAQRLRLLKFDPKSEPLDVAAPDVDVDAGDTTTVTTDADE